MASQRKLVVIGAAALMVAAGSTEALASAACDQVNAGGFNVTNYVPSGSSNVATISGFAVGEHVNFTVSGLGGDFELLNGAVNTVLASQTLSASPAQTSYTVTGTNSDTTLVTHFSIHAIPYSITIAATCAGPTPTPTPSSSSDASKALVRGFLLGRMNAVLLNSPVSTSLINRSNGMPSALAGPPASGASNTNAFGSGSPSTMGLGSSIALGANPFDDAGTGTVSFATSLSQMRRQAAQAQMQKDRMALGVGDGGALPAAYEINSPWDLWTEGRYSGYKDDAGNFDRNGHTGLLYVGSDYRIAPDMIIGALVQFDWAEDQSGLLTSKVDGKGWMAGPYLSARVHDNIYLDLRAAWGRSSNDLALGATTGSFDTSRWLVKGTLAGNWLYDCWRLTPSAELAYLTERQDTFTNSAGTFIPSQDISLGRLQFGPEIGYRFAQTSNTFVEPFAAIKGVWDFDNPNIAIVDGIVVGPSDLWGRLEGGLNVLTTSGWYVRGLASWDGIGASDYNGYTLQGILNVPLN